MQKTNFLKRLEKEAPNILKELENGYFSDILKIFEMENKNERDYYIRCKIADTLDMIEKEENEKASKIFFLMSELPDISNQLKSFCTDAMFVAENDFNGEFNSLYELKKYYFDNIKAQ